MNFVKLRRRLFAFWAASVMGAVCLSGQAAIAQDLVVGLKTEPSSLDPAFHSLLPNIQVSTMVFDTLVGRDENMNLVPRLAESWVAEGNTWIFRLRPDVLFSDGTPFTADDVVFSIRRIPLVPNSPSPFTIYLQQITDVQAEDPLTVKITTQTPYPLVPNNLTSVFIMSSHAAQGTGPEGKTTVQLNAGDGLVGTGPYKFVSWQRGSDLVFERNHHYWGEAPAWEKVTLRIIPNAASRLAALQAGDVDLIEDAPVDDLARLRETPGIRVVIKGPTNRLIFLGLDVDRENSPGISGTDGVNPLKDHRVREALSLAIDRAALDARVMNGMATPAAQVLPYPMFGTSERLNVVPPVDLERAKALMVEAGYPNGFTLVLASPNGRYINDSRVAQTIAAMWARVGVKTTVDAPSVPVFFSNAQNLNYSAYMMGWGPLTGETSNSLGAIVGTVNRDTGMGTTNYGRYSNQEVDRLIFEAMQELDDEKRSELLQQAGEIALADYAILPVHFEHSSWAMKDSIIMYSGRQDQMTLVQDILPAGN